MVFHKNCIFVFGGEAPQAPPLSDNDCRFIYKYNLNSKAWLKMQTNFLGAASSFGNLSGHSCVVSNNVMFLFGGKNQQTGEYLNQIWGLNLESLNWKKPDLKGHSPQPREFASMLLHSKNFILVYGGRAHGKNLNDMHVLKVDAKIWLHVSPESYEFKVPCRLRPAICSYGDYIYLFGGEREVADKSLLKREYLQDFYQLRLINRSSTRIDVWTKKILTSFHPSARAAVLTPYNDKYLLLYGG